MLLAIRILTAAVAMVAVATIVVASSIFGSTVSSASTPVPVSTQAPVPAPSGPEYLLPGGLALPHGSAPVGAPTHSVSAHDIRRWEVRLDLGPVTGAEALASLADQLRRAGWEISGGKMDFVAVRQHDGRWEIVVARWPAPSLTSEHTLGVGIGSRPA